MQIKILYQYILNRTVPENVNLGALSYFVLCLRYVFSPLESQQI